MDGGARLQLGGFGGGAGETSIISRIMLRFRPIAPKPADGEPFPGAFPAEGPGGAVSRRRVKRKYRVRARKRRSIHDGGKISRSDVSGGETGSRSADTAAATLQLLPGREEDRELAGAGSGDGRSQDLQAGSERGGTLKIGSETVGTSDLVVVESRVTVESVGDACMGAGGSFGSTDVERVRSLELDTCPGFVTDKLNRVQWLNAAYVALVTGRCGREEEAEAAAADVRVEVAKKEELPWWSAAFTCQVRVEHTWRNVRYSKLVPCDVWRLGWGGFAWRLDVKAALSLGF